MFLCICYWNWTFKDKWVTYCRDLFQLNTDNFLKPYFSGQSSLSLSPPNQIHGTGVGLTLKTQSHKAMANPQLSISAMIMTTSSGCRVCVCVGVNSIVFFYPLKNLNFYFWIILGYCHLVFLSSLTVSNSPSIYVVILTVLMEWQGVSPELPSLYLMIALLEGGKWKGICAFFTL